MKAIRNYLRLRKSQNEVREKTQQLMDLCEDNPKAAKLALNNGLGERLAKQLNTLSLAINEIKSQSLTVKLISKLGI